MAVINQSLSEAIRFLKTGLIGIPTETVYGLAGNAYNAEIVARIFEVKERPSFDPLIVHTHSISEIEKFTKLFPNELQALAQEFWPGPLTLLIPKNELIPDIVTSGLENVAVRIPNHPLTLELLKSIDFPLAAPSANPFGYISPTSAMHVNDQLGDKIPFILDGGPSGVGLESTIVGLVDGLITVFRLGGISLEDIEGVCGSVRLKNNSSNPLAPGMTDAHYAPGKRLLLGSLSSLLQVHHDKNPVLICYDKMFESYPSELQIVLAPTGDVRIAAANLFAALRKADKLAESLILAEPVPNQGLGRAINDRLKRAAF
ncbi:MAG: L-threonylcarbamoyladenylate synthase [Bacteroidia bacterium]